MRPIGFRPSGGISMAATEAFAKTLGYVYVSPVGGSAGMRDGLAVIPSEMANTDLTYYDPTFAQFRHAGVQTADDAAAFVEGFLLTLDDIADSGNCRSPVCHVTTPLDTPQRKDSFRRIVELTIADDRLWKPTLGEAADWMLARPEGLPTERLRSFEPDWDPRAFVANDG